MIHNGVVVDKDPYFVIDPITRIITNQSTNKVNIIQFDHNSERFTFSMPRIVEGHDMSECNVVQVHYANTDAVTMEQTTGIYTVDDLQIDENDNETITLSWLLSQNVTQRVGKLEFLIRFACTDTESNIMYAWNTAIFDTIKVAKGMNNTGVIEQTYPDVLVAKEDRLNKVDTITGKETSEKYPTALAVIDYLKKNGGSGGVLTSVPTEYTVGDVGRLYAYVDYTENENGIAKQLYACTQKYEIPGERTTYLWVEVPFTGDFENDFHRINEELSDTHYRKDGTVCKSAGDALRTLEVEVNGYSEVGKNKCDPNAFSERYSTINSVGEVVSNTMATFVTGYIPVADETHVVVSYTTGSGQTAKTVMHEIVFYDTSGNVLSRIKDVSEADIPDGAVGLRVLVPQQYWEAKQRIMVEFGDDLTTYESYRVISTLGLKQTKVDIDGENQVTIKNAEFINYHVSRNMFNKYTRADGYTMQTDGSITTNDIRSASDFIYCYGETVFSVSDGTQGVFCFYDENKNFLAPYGVYSSGGTANVSIPENAYYLRTSLPKNTAETFMLVFAESVGEFEEYGTFCILDDAIEVPKAKSVDVIGSDPKRIISEILKTGGQIKFLGDSITAGVGGTGFAEDGDTIVNQYKVNTSGYCMTNLFKSYIESKYNNTVLNYGTRGIRSYNLKTWLSSGQVVTEEDKLLIVMIGTNNKWATENSTLQDLKSDLEWLINWCKNNNKKLILISAPVSSVQQDTTYSDGSAVKFHNEDIDHAYKEVCYENNCDYIPMYQKMLEYCDFTNTSIDEILSDGLHPNDKGYYIMYKILMRSLGLAYQLPGSDWDNATPN